jgi:UPF0755 protein
MKKSLIWLLVIAPLLAFAMLSVHVSYLIGWKYSGAPVEFQVAAGEGFSRINHRLSQEHLISNPRVFHHYTKFQGKLEKIQVGVYRIENGMTMGDILFMLTEGKSIIEPLTIPEGKNLYEIGDILEQKKITSKKEFVSLATSAEFVKKLNLQGETLEGYLFPETYKFAPGSSAETVIKTMVRQYEKKTENLNFSGTTLSPYDVLILASIVEKETGAKAERKTIAGVFSNRLQKNMRLQSDPTTIYGIWNRFKGNLRKQDLMEKTDYNTYQISRLPKGPICNPSLEAIEAVLNPEKHSYLFFVSRNDGTHVFTVTYQEHQKAVDHFQKNRANREGKSWRMLKQ